MKIMYFKVMCTAKGNEYHHYNTNYYTFAVFANKGCNADKIKAKYLDKIKANLSAKNQDIDVVVKLSKFEVLNCNLGIYSEINEKS